MNWGWANAADDARVEVATNNLITRTIAIAKQLGLEDPYIYMNYASLDQNVYAGYGARNVQRLKQIKAKYDPQNIFGRLWRGYFKL